MFAKKTEVWSFRDFMDRKPPTRVEGGVPDEVKVFLVKGAAVALVLHTGLGAETAFAASTGPVSSAFNERIWPLLLDIGQPLAKTMMCIGIYKCIRNNVEEGWKLVYRSGIGLVGLFLIDGAIDIIAGVGADLSHVEVNVGATKPHP